MGAQTPRSSWLPVLVCPPIRWQDSRVTCHCGSEKSFETCCKPLIEGKEQASTAEQLMRSRYSAFVLGDVDYIINTHDPKTRGEVNREDTEAWAKQSTWTGLEILELEAGAENDTEGRVDFVANYELKGTAVAHRESAIFRKEGQRWFFVDGVQLAGPPVRREEPKVGRNDTCPCGSGKKYKKCHGKAA